MQLREKGRRVQVIRATYKQEAGRAVATVLFTIPNSRTPILSDDQAAELSDHERAEVEAWFADRRAKAEASELQIKVEYAPRSLAHLAAALDAASDELLAGLPSTWAAETWAALDAVSKTLRRRHVAKPKRLHAGQSRDPRQRDLV